MSVAEFWPEKGVQSAEWELLYRQNAPVSNAGNSVSVDHGEPYWVAKVTVEVPKNSPLAKQWSSFFSRRQGSRNTFSMNRSFQSFPADRTPTPATPPVIDFVRRTDGLMRVTGHGAYRVTAGDMVGYFTENSGFYIGEAFEVVASVAAQLQFKVNPPPFEHNATEANFRFVKALGEFRMVGAPSSKETSKSRSWSFTAEQVIRG